MKIQVNTDRHIEGGAVLKEKVGDVVARAVERSATASRGWRFISRT
jgi:hypothetical protein